MTTSASGITAAIADCCPSDEMDAIDYHLVAKAQALAGADVHRLNNLLCIYMAASDSSASGCHRRLHLAIGAERKLRAYVCMKELALAQAMVPPGLARPTAGD